MKVTICNHPVGNKACPHILIYKSQVVGYTWYYCDGFREENKKIIKCCEECEVK